MRSAWPLCRAYSSIMWQMIQRRLGDRPSGQVRRASWSEAAAGQRLGHAAAGAGHVVLPEPAELPW